LHRAPNPFTSSGNGGSHLITDIASRYLVAKKKYDLGVEALPECFGVVRDCLTQLRDRAQIRHFGNFSTKDALAYSVAESEGVLSRPFRPEIFIADPAQFAEEAIVLLASLGNPQGINPDALDRIVYTSITAFSLAYDVWKPKSRKTPGTFFEVVIGSASRVIFPGYVLTKHIPIKDLPVTEAADALAETCEIEATSDEAEFSGDSVSTDLVITNPKTGKGAIVPLKITTRERIVQPFAHQRILDSAYPGQYASFVACISEVQRDDKTTTVKQICVPGTIALFQKHLSKINGLYYCDIPRRYAQDDFNRIMPVKPFHQLFSDISTHLGDI
jgi:hypothetical protein